MSRPRPLRTLFRALPALLALAGLAALPAVPRAQEDEIVPAGVWRIRLEHGWRTDDRGISRLDVEAPLLDYLVPDEAVRNALDGSVERRVERTELSLTLGLTDAWNVVLELPYVSVAQTSSATSASTDTAVTETLERLESRTVSGLGRLRLAGLHRPVFSDRHGFVWGFGVDWPGDDPVSPWVGRSTLQVDSPFRRVFVLVHYTHYPWIQRARLDVRGEYGLGQAESLEVPDGTAQKVVPGNDVALSLGWRQEVGPVTSGLGFHLDQQSTSEVEGVRQGDQVQEFYFRLVLGFGNLRKLEQAPIAFPYLVLLTYDHTVQGFNTPLRREFRLSLKTYF